MSKVTTIYTAVHKGTGEVICGIKKQYAYSSASHLKRSMQHSLADEAELEGVEVEELYNIHEINVEKLIKEGVI